MPMVTIVKPIAISGETSAIVFDRSARFSSTNCMRRFLLLQTASAHQQAELLAAGLSGRHRFRQPAVEHHGDPVGNLSELIQILAGNEDGGAGGAEIERGLADDGGRSGVHAPGRRGDHETPRRTQNFAVAYEYL